QWVFSGPTALFGGLSGVLYGLLGYCWLYQLLAPNMHFDLPRGVVVMMLAWLVFCLSGIISVLGFGAIANAAHVGGLVVGCICGVIAGGMQRMRRALYEHPPRWRICAGSGSHRGRCSYRSGIGVRAPAPGANMCWPGSHRGRCSYKNETAVGAPASGAKMCLPRFAPRAVLLQERN